MEGAYLVDFTQRLESWSQTWGPKKNANLRWVFGVLWPVYYPKDPRDWYVLTITYPTWIVDFYGKSVYHTLILWDLKRGSNHDIERHYSIYWISWFLPVSCKMRYLPSTLDMHYSGSNYGGAFWSTKIGSCLLSCSIFVQVKLFSPKQRQPHSHAMNNDMMMDLLQQFNTKTGVIIMSLYYQPQNTHY